MQGSGLIDLFQLPEEKTANFLRGIEAGYHDNPYHSQLHAASVLQTTHMIAQNGLIQEGVVDGPLQLASYLSGGSSENRFPGSCSSEHLKECHRLRSQRKQQRKVTARHKT